MRRTGRKKEWSILVFCVFMLCVFPPVLFVFDKPILIAGMPLSFLYLFSLWAVVIFCIAIGARRRATSAESDQKYSVKAQEQDRFSPRISRDV